MKHPVALLSKALRLAVAGFALVLLLGGGSTTAAGNSRAEATQPEAASKSQSVRGATPVLPLDATPRRLRDRLALGGGDRRAWTASEKGLMWSYVALNAIDAYQTINVPGDAVEINPLLTAIAGERPGVAETVLFKAAMTYGTLRLADRIQNPKTRKWVLATITVLQLGVVAHNEAVTGGIVF